MIGETPSVEVEETVKEVQPTLQPDQQPPNLESNLFQQPTFVASENVPTIPDVVQASPETRPASDSEQTGDYTQTLESMIANPSQWTPKQVRDALEGAVNNRNLAQIQQEDPKLYEGLHAFFEASQTKGLRSAINLEEVSQVLPDAESDNDPKIIEGIFTEIKNPNQTPENTALLTQQYLSKGGNPQELFALAQQEPKMLQALNELADTTTVLAQLNQGAEATTQQVEDGSLEVTTTTGEKFTVKEYALFAGLVLLDIVFFKGQNTTYLAESMLNLVAQRGLNGLCVKYGLDPIIFANSANESMSKVFEVMDAASLDRLLEKSSAQELFNILESLDVRERQKMVSGERFASKFGLGGHQLNEAQRSELTKKLSTLSSGQRVRLGLNLAG